MVASKEFFNFVNVGEARQRLPIFLLDNLFPCFTVAYTTMPVVCENFIHFCSTLQKVHTFTFVRNTPWKKRNGKKLAFEETSFTFVSTLRKVNWRFRKEEFKGVKNDHFFSCHHDDFQNHPLWLKIKMQPVLLPKCSSADQPFICEFVNRQVLPLFGMGIRLSLN